MSIVSLLLDRFWDISIYYVYCRIESEDCWGGKGIVLEWVLSGGYIGYIVSEKIDFCLFMRGEVEIMIYLGFSF